jgi:hypothetical protein
MNGEITSWKITLITSLISVVIGALLGFGLQRLTLYLNERNKKKKSLNYLLKEMWFNYNLLEKVGWNRWRELKISGYKISEKYLILNGFSEELISKIHRLYTTIEHLLKGKLVHPENTIGEILKLLKQILPEYEKELKNKNFLLK